MGWNFIVNISKYHDLWVITEKEKFEKEIEVELEKTPKLKNSITFFYIPKVRHKKLRKLWPPSYYWFYKAWQKDAHKLACKLEKSIDFDLVHQLNMVGFREPGYLWKLDLPFVWGPIGGMVQFPWRFLSLVGIRGSLFHIGRNIINHFQSRYLIRVKKAIQKSKGSLISATKEMQNQIQKLHGVDSYYISEIGQHNLLINTITMRDDFSKLRLCWSGQHTEGKALPLLLKALSQVSEKVVWKLDILGEGSKTKSWQRMSKKLNINQNCIWHGWLSKKNAIKVMENSNVQIITSLKDLSSTVTLEALSLGIPVICLDHCGFGDIITSDCGIKISVRNPKQVIDDLAKAIELLYGDEAHRYSLAKGALKRSEDYSWDKKTQILNQIYENITNS